MRNGNKDDLTFLFSIELLACLNLLQQGLRLNLLLVRVAKLLTFEVTAEATAVGGWLVYLSTACKVPNLISIRVFFCEHSDVSFDGPKFVETGGFIIFIEDHILLSTLLNSMPS